MQIHAAMSLSLLQFLIYASSESMHVLFTTSKNGIPLKYADRTSFITQTFVFKSVISLIVFSVVFLSSVCVISLNDNE